jgi:4-carboxymuconolactone decarboxylase
MAVSEAARKNHEEPRAEVGRAVQEQIVGREGVDKLYASAPPDEAHIQRFLSANCFGDHLARSGIDLRTRELLTFSMLVSLGGCEPQVRGHVAANLRSPSVRCVAPAEARETCAGIGIASPNPHPEDEPPEPGTTVVHCTSSPG